MHTTDSHGEGPRRPGARTVGALIALLAAIGCSAPATSREASAPVMESPSPSPSPLPVPSPELMPSPSTIAPSPAEIITSPATTDSGPLSPSANPVPGPLAAGTESPVAAGPASTAGTATLQADALRLQVLLDRAHFSPGEIDGVSGSNTRLAMDAYAKEKGGEPQAALQALAADPAPTLVEYTITAGDVAGPFERRIPTDMMEKAKLKALTYTSPLEELAERFHCSPKLLRRLNADATFTQAGERIRVPNVRSGAPGVRAARVVVDKSDQAIYAVDAQGRPIARYPATMGSEHDPLPLGSWKITGVSKNPTFRYNPDLFWDADGRDSKAKIPAGPNNPVGVVWLDLSKQHYGIHGTPEPSAIGKTESHGCIRLTNWDAEELSEMVGPGTPAVLQE
jgi:lipoprotein-anchoring transpeptidase ErfK/SrfK